MYRLRHSKTPFWNKSKTAFSALVSERTFHGEAACEKAGVRPIPDWWRWRESTRGLKNSPPDCFSRTAVRRPVRLLALKAQTAPAPSGDDGAGALGGDGGSRTRVRKRVPAAFYERSRALQIPLERHRTAGGVLR